MIPALALTLDPTPRWLDDLAVPLGAQVVDLHDGYVFPIRAGDVPAGFVFVGAAAARLQLATAADAEALADPLRTELGIDSAPLVRDLRWTETADVAVVLGRGDLLNVPFLALPAVVDSKATAYRDADGQEHVVVDAMRPDRALDLARRSLADRAEALSADGLDPAAMIALDALRDEPRWLAELRTAHAWKPLLPGADWLSLSHDPTGAADDDAIDRLYLHDGPHERVLTRFGAPVEGASIDRGTVNLVVEREPAGLGLDVTGETVLDLVAETRTSLLPLAIPRGEEPPTGAGISVPPGYALDEVSIAGRTVTRIADRWGRKPDGSWDAGTWRIEPPLEAGERAVVRVRWTDRWAGSHPLDVQAWGSKKLWDIGYCHSQKTCDAAVAGWPQLVELGRESIDHRPAPIDPDRTAAFPIEVRLGTTLGADWHATISGGTPFHDGGDGRWTVSTTDSTARVAVGRYSVTRANAVGPFPSIEVLSLDAPQGSPSFLRAALQFFRPVLPPYPYAAIALVEAPAELELGRFADGPAPITDPLQGMGVDPAAALETDAADPPTVTAWPAQAVIHGFRDVGASGPVSTERAIDQSFPEAVDRGVVHALAEHWWDRPAYPDEDRWIASAAAGWYRDRFVDVAWGPSVAEPWERRRLAGVDRSLEQRYAPLVGSDDSEDVGIGILRAVSARIGEQATLRGLDRFLAEGPPTTAGLVSALSEASGVDLTGFFAAWVQAGIHPDLDVTWSADRGAVAVDVKADVPFGRWSVPIAVSVGKGEPHLGWVEVVNGVGHAGLAIRGTPSEVEVDPHRWLPIRHVDVREATR